MIVTGDCVEVMAGMDPESVDAKWAVCPECGRYRARRKDGTFRKHIARRLRRPYDEYPCPYSNLLPPSEIPR